MADEADLLSIGKHCSVSSCKRLDFLPFECSNCKDVFCLEHRTPQGHECANVDLKDARIPVCPICGQLIKKSKHDDVNIKVEKHILSGCKDSVIGKPRKNNKCSIKSCRQHGLMPFVCPECKKNHCIRHRLAEDHFCPALNVPLVACP